MCLPVVTSQYILIPFSTRLIVTQIWSPIMTEVSEASSTTTKKEPMVRLGIYVKRHPSLTSEEFHEYGALNTKVTFYKSRNKC
jgi:hypothetical protein